MAVPDDFYVEIVAGEDIELLTSVSYPPEGIDIGVPAVVRNDIAIIKTGDPLPTDPEIQLVFQVPA